MSERSSIAQDQLDLIFKTAPMGLMLLNEDLEMIFFNPALLDCLEYEVGELENTCLTDLCHPRDRGILESFLESSVSGASQSLPSVIRLRQGDGSYLWVEMAVGKNPPGAMLPGGYVVVIQDVQNQKEMEMEVLELRHRLNVRVEQERNQLAQELHDGPMQDLHSIQYQLSALQKRLPESTGELLQGALDTVGEVSQDLRNISYDLRPPALSRYGLAKSIQSHAEEFAQNHPEFTLTLDLEDDGDRLEEDIRLALFRIYQQALGNILQHSQASAIKISLRFIGADVELVIQDDGKGFKLPERWISLVREGHYGLAGSHDRVISLGGEFRVESAPGKGTSLRVIVPDLLEEEI